METSILIYNIKMKKSVIVGIIQDSSVYLDRDKSMDEAEILLKNAAIKGAELMVFGETWLSGYPAWLGIPT